MRFRKHIFAIVVVVIFIILSYFAYPVKGRETGSGYAYGAESPSNDYWKGYVDGYSEVLQFINKADKSERTVGEVSLFLAQDDTDNLTGITCAGFSGVLCGRARQAGFSCDFVILYFVESVTPHAIVAFSTTLGLIYVEPQTDEVIYDISRYMGKVSHIVRWI